MKIDPNATPMPGLQTVARPQRPSPEAKDAFQAPVGTAVETLEKSNADVDHLKSAVAKLQAMPDIRPEVVKGRSQADAAQSPTDAQLMSFISALRNEEI